MEKSEKTPKKLKIRKRKNMLFFPLILPILRIKKNVKKAYFSRGERGRRGGGVHQNVTSWILPRLFVR